MNSAVLVERPCARPSQSFLRALHNNVTMLHEHCRGFGSAGSLPGEHSAGAQRAAMLQRERAKRKKKDEGLQGGVSCMLCLIQLCRA